MIHEVLIRKWEKLKGWINEKRDAIAYKKILENDINQYERKEEVSNGPRSENSHNLAKKQSRFGRRTNHLVY